MNLKIVDVEQQDLNLAVTAARQFIQEGKPIGIRHGTGHLVNRPFYADWMGVEPDGVSFYVYSTKTMIVVRGSK